VPLFLGQAIELLDWYAPDLGLWDAHLMNSPAQASADGFRSAA
jgi:hypothetical protein